MTLDPQLAEILAKAERSGRPPLDDLPLAEARLEYRRRADVFGLPPEPMAAIEERSVVGVAGPIRVRLYIPDRRHDALLVFYHGGGWTVGDCDTHDRACRFLAARGACRVASVDYRLAPEHPYPAAVEDAWSAWRSIVANAHDWAAADRLAVGGDSAGGNLATVVAHRAKARAVAPQLQLLIYPAVDHVGRYESMERYAKGYLLTTPLIDRFQAYYLPDLARRAEPDASPLRHGDFRGLAPAFIQTAGFDPLQDEGAAYAKKLGEAGVAVEHKHYPSLVHGYMQLAVGVKAAKAAMEDAAAALRRALL